MRWALLGASDACARRVLPALRAVGEDVSRIYSSSAERAREFAHRNGVVFATRDLAVALDAVDAVYVSSSNERHAPHVLAAAAPGRLVLCEKPLARRAEGALTVIDILRPDSRARILAKPAGS
jgi:1,5-anhydro-D-fructose reductase (1,5-anhydro-D-mannitol-forming)